MTVRGPSVTWSRPAQPSVSLRHLPSDMSPIRECDHATDKAGAGGIPERLHETWYLRGTRSSELPNVPHVDGTIPSSRVDLASVWGPASLRSGIERHLGPNECHETIHSG